MTEKIDQKFARWLLPTILNPDRRTEGMLCACYNRMAKSYTLDLIRVAARLAKQRQFNTIDHFFGWFTLALKNLHRGQHVEQDYIYEDRLD